MGGIGDCNVNKWEDLKIAPTYNHAIGALVRQNGHQNGAFSVFGRVLHGEKADKSGKVVWSWRKVSVTKNVWLGLEVGHFPIVWTGVWEAVKVVYYCRTSVLAHAMGHLRLPAEFSSSGRLLHMTTGSVTCETVVLITEETLGKLCMGHVRERAGRYRRETVQLLTVAPNDRFRLKCKMLSEEPL